MYMQYHHTGKSLLLHCCPKVGLDSPQGTKRPLRGSICCQHYQDQLEETSNLEKWSGQSWTSQTACYGPVTLKVMHACNYIISSQIHLPKSLETTCWTHLQLASVVSALLCECSPWLLCHRSFPQQLGHSPMCGAGSPCQEILLAT